jgi:hypothetical protein
MAVEAFSSLEEYQLIVIGDKKSPENWKCSKVDYISVKDQENLGFEMVETLPYNHYCRKMLGYLLAIQSGARCIVDTDDDNIPKENWHFPAFDGQYESIKGDKGFINIYQLYSQQNIWPRGLPLNLITTDFSLENELFEEDCKVGVWQGLADESPDVDAIYRLTNDKPCTFNKRDPVVLAEGTITPFNTQNTIIREELFPLLYLPTYTTFRFTDILRGLVAQPIMWVYGYRLGFINATVVQKRNQHDYMEDFVSEIPMYKHCETIVEKVVRSVSANESIEANLFNAYKTLHSAKIVCDREIKNLETWLRDLQKLT